MRVPDQRTKVRLLPSFLVPAMAMDENLLSLTKEGGLRFARCQHVKLICDGVV